MILFLYIFTGLIAILIAYIIYNYNIYKQKYTRDIFVDIMLVSTFIVLSSMYILGI